jgi:hypothetical protein
MGTTPDSPIPSVARARGLAAAEARHRGRDSASYAERSRDLAAAKIAQYVEKVLAAAPPLTSEQQSTLVAIIVGGAK